MNKYYYFCWYAGQFKTFKDSLPWFWGFNLSGKEVHQLEVKDYPSSINLNLLYLLYNQKE